MIDSGLAHCNQFEPSLLTRQTAVSVEKLSQEQE